jgi:CRISPR-associated protein Csb1
MSQTSLDPKALLESKAHRLTLHAILAPTAGKDRIQPAGFPEIGHVIYPSPQPDGTTRNVCIVDSAASMANHLETVCHEGRFGMDLHEDIAGLPHVQCVTDDNGPRWGDCCLTY